MSKWREVRFKDAIEFNPKVKLDKNRHYPCIGIANIDESSLSVYENESLKYTGQSSSKFKSGDVLFSRITPCLENRKIARVFLESSDRGFGSTELFVFRGKKGKTLTKFVSYLAQTDIIVLPAINSMSGASGRQRADRYFIEKLKIKIPDLETQKKIADVLSTYDELIENNNRRIEILEKTAEEIYKEWFVRMRFPGYENIKFNKGIPERWEVKRIGDVAKLVHGYTESADEKPIGPKYLRGTDINKESYINWEEVPYCGIKDTNVDKYKLYKNDIVIIRMADPGKVAIVESNIDAVFASYLIKIDYDKDKVRPYYMFYFLYSDSYREHIKSFSNGTTRSSINSKMILSSKILVPSIQIQEEFNKRSSVIREMLNKLINKNQNLIKQRDLLLPRLMNGTIEIR
ncbi:MAG: restriction endonuclease subunit S [Peptococcia bacterium]|jgi:hypothetical protein